MRVIIAGSRGITDYNLVLEAIDKSGFNITSVVSGTARGIDKLGEKYAEEEGLLISYFPADWDQYGKSAGYIRNKQMAEFADALIAIWDGKSRGTLHMVDIMQKLNKPTFIYKEAD